MHPAVLAVALILAAATQLVAQDPSDPRPEMEFAGNRTDSLFSLPRSLDEIKQWADARDDLEKGALDGGVERLYRLARTTRGGVVRVGLDRFLGMRHAVLETLVAMTPEGRQAWNELTTRELGALASKPLVEWSHDELDYVARDFPGSDTGLRARVRLGENALLMGQPQLAVQHFRAGLDAAPQVDLEAVAAGDEDAITNASIRDALTKRLDTASLLTDPTETRAGRTREAMLEVVQTVVPALPSGDHTGWRGFGGGGDGATPMDRPIGKPSQEFLRDVQAAGFDASFPMHAVGGLEGVFVNDGRILFNFDPLTREVLWALEGPMAGAPVAEPFQERRGRRRRGNFGTGSPVNEDRILSAALGQDSGGRGIAVAALEVPSGSKEVEFRNTIRIIASLPRRRLFACERDTGRLLWSHWDGENGPITSRFAGHDTAAPPLIVGDTLYSTSQDRSGAIAFYVTAYAIDTGAVRWRRLVCSSQTEVNMFGNAQREFAASPLAEHDGLLFGSSNLGVCYCIEAATGSIRWISAYDVVRMPETRLQGQERRPIYFLNSPPVVANGVVALTPLDSAYALGMDTLTGRLEWRLDFRCQLDSESYWISSLLGAHGTEFIFAGKGVVAIEARAGTPSPPQENESLRSKRMLRPIGRAIRTPGSLVEDDRSHLRVRPRGALTANAIWHASGNRITAFDFQGNTLPDAQGILPSAPGNLLLSDGLIVAVGRRTVEMFFDNDALFRRARQRVEDDPLDLEALALQARLLEQRATASGDSEQLLRVITLYERALATAASQGLGTGNATFDRIARSAFELRKQVAEDSVMTRAPIAASLELFRAARATAPDSRSWLDAQTLLLELNGLDDETRLAELEQMRRIHGTERYGFTGVGRVPVDAWTLYEMSSIHRSSEPKRAVNLLQELIDRYPDERFGARPLRDVATIAQEQIISLHGEEAYAAVEAAAAEALQAAGKDARRLEAVRVRYPLAKTRRTALDLLLDLAVARGDVASAVDAYRDALATERDPETGTQAPPGLLRRMQAAAIAGGNTALGRALASRLARDFGEVASDWPDDEGRSYGELAKQLPALPIAPSPTRQRPARKLAELTLPGGVRGMRFVPAWPVAGFERSKREQENPVLFSLQGGTLAAFEPFREGLVGELEGTAGPPLWSIGVGYVSELYLAGSLLIVPDGELTMGIEPDTGARRWIRETPERQRTALGVLDGVLLVHHQPRFTGQNDQPSVLEGLEITTGRVLFERVLSGHPARTVAFVSGDHLLVLRNSSDGTAPQSMRLDPLTGLRISQTVWAKNVIDALGSQTRAVTSRAVVDRFASANGEFLFLGVPGNEIEDRPPQVLAIGDDGNLAWSWSGFPGRQLLFSAPCGPMRDALVVAEGGPQNGGALLRLDPGSGTVVQQRSLADGARSMHMRRMTWKGAPPLGAVFVAARQTNRNWRLTMLSLHESIPSLEVAFPPGTTGTVSEPFVGEDFFAFGSFASPEGPATTRARIDVRKLGIPDEGALADGTSAVLGSGARPHEIHGFGVYTVLQSNDGLTVYGETLPPAGN